MDSARGLQVHPQVWWFDIRTHRTQYTVVLLRFITVKDVKQNQQRKGTRDEVWKKPDTNFFQESSPMACRYNLNLKSADLYLLFVSFTLSLFTPTWIWELSSVSSSSHKRLHNEDRGWDGWMASPARWT